MICQKLLWSGNRGSCGLFRLIEKYISSTNLWSGNRGILMRCNFQSSCCWFATLCSWTHAYHIKKWKQNKKKSCQHTYIISLVIETPLHLYLLTAAIHFLLVPYPVLLWHCVPPVDSMENYCHFPAYVAADWISMVCVSSTNAQLITIWLVDNTTLINMLQ